MTMGREAMFTMSMLGVTPLIQQKLVESSGWERNTALAAGSLSGALLAGVITHPMDTIKSCMQGDLGRAKYDGIVQTGKAIAAELPSRNKSAIQCLHRWHKVLNHPEVVKGNWTSEEDDRMQPSAQPLPHQQPTTQPLPPQQPSAQLDVAHTGPAAVAMQQEVLRLQRKPHLGC